MDLLNRKRVESSRDTSVGMWVQELGMQEPQLVRIPSVLMFI